MSDFKCTFCGSDKLKIDKPYMTKDKVWPMKYKTEQDYCCRTQAKNQEYREKKFHPTRSTKPTSEEVAKL